MAKVNIESFYEKLEFATFKPLNVVLEGESGAGKEHFARLIHEKRGYQGDFLVFDWECDHICQHQIIESLVKSHLSTMLSGTNQKRNTYFFRRIDLLGSQAQLEIFELLENEITRDGLSRSQLHQLGLIASAEKKHGNEGTQNDLTLNRLLELFPLRITITPLRQRREEFGSLMHHILESVNKQLNRKVSGFSFETFYFFRDYYWPNNIDELRSEIEGAVALTKDHDLIRPEVLSERLIKSQTILKMSDFSR